jgi:hypothetical protein
VKEIILEEMGDIGDGKTGIQYLMQDKFHVAHGFSPKFNNLDPRFQDIIIRGWRDITSHLDKKREDRVDAALKAGLVRKKVTYRGVPYEIKTGAKKTQEEIDLWKRIGVYHEMFSKGDVVVPEHIAAPETLHLNVTAWRETVISEIFDDNEQPIRMFGKALIPTPEVFRELVDNALARILNCVPPDGLDAWRSSGRLDHNDFEIMLPNFHTCGCEMINAQQTAFCVGDNNTKELSTACHFEGNARLIQRKEERLGRREKIGHNDPSKAHDANRLAGHGPASKLPKLVGQRPHNIDKPPPAHSEEVCVQEIGPFDRSSSKLAALTEERRSLQPSFDPVRPLLDRPRVRQSTLLANPLHQPVAAPLPQCTVATAVPLSLGPATFPTTTLASAAVERVTLPSTSSPAAALPPATLPPASLPYASSTASGAATLPPAAALPTAAPPTAAPPTIALSTTALSIAALSTAALPPAAASLLQQCTLDGGPPVKRQRRTSVIESRSNLYFCNCKREWPRPKGTQGNPNHHAQCARKQRAAGVIEEAVLGQVLKMLPAIATFRPSVRFVGPGADDWEPISILCPIAAAGSVPPQP